MEIRIILWLFLSVYNSRHVVNSPPPEQKNNIKTASFGPSVEWQNDTNRDCSGYKLGGHMVRTPRVEISVLPR
jgi:hypothetical protein